MDGEVFESADAQSREGRWEFALGLSYQLSASPNFEGGKTIDTDNDFGFVTDFGYNFTDNVAVTFGFSIPESATTPTSSGSKWAEFSRAVG